MKSKDSFDETRDPWVHIPIEDIPIKTESVYVSDMAQLKAHIIYTLQEHYGERCETKDTDDFPEMLEPPYLNNDKDWGRCPTRLVYEKFDEFWGALYADVEVS